MPKKFLDLLKKLKEKLSKLLARNQSKEEVFLNVSPNLLNPVKVEGKIAKASPSIVKVTSNVIHFVAFIFVVFFAINFFMDRTLNSMSAKRDDFITQIDANYNVNKQAKEVTDLLKIYTSAKSNYPKIANLATNLIDISSKYVSLEYVDYRRDVKSLTFISRSPTASSYAFLITELLKVPEVDSIVIESVTLKIGSKKDYQASLEIKIK